MNIEIPDGVRVFNRKETYQIDFILEKIEDIFKKWGYEKITLPSFEYMHVHEKGIGKDVSEKAFKLVDRSSGKILSLRADFTSQIARYFSSLKRKVLPKRYYYIGNIYRYVEPKAGNLWERLQAGIELIGSDKLEADAEIIAIAYNSLRAIGINNFQIDINSTQLFTNLKNILNLDKNKYFQLMEYIKNREVFNLEKFCEENNTEGALKEFIVNIPNYQGDIDLIVSLKEKVKDIPEINSVLEELESIYFILSLYGVSNIRFDLGEPKEFSYYTGIIFEVFVKGFSKPLAQGGRYDNLISKYNGNFPATGFAFDILNIWEYGNKTGILPEKKEKDFFIIDLSENKEIALKLARILREKGYTVSRDISYEDYQTSVKSALEEGFKNIIVIGLDKDKESIYIFTSTQEEKIKIKDFLDKV